MKITLNYAGNGDCILVESGNTRILFDGGTAASYSKWKENINRFRDLDCLVVTHFDSDHTNGIIKLLESNQKPIINNILFNSANEVLELEDCLCGVIEDIEVDALSSRLASLPDEDFNIGFSEGTSLSYLIRNQNIKSNKKAITSDEYNSINVGEISMQVISPSMKTLKKLKNQWFEVLNDEGVKRKILTKSHSLAFENYLRSLKEDNFEEITANTYLDIDTLAEFIYKKDSSLANESSLAFLLQNGKSSILMLGDCHAEDVLTWLDKKNIKELKVDAVKLSHHGSKHNINKELVERLNCGMYLVSTNGEVFKHPDLETLALLAKYSINKKVKIMINNPIKHVTKNVVKNFLDYNGTEIILDVKEFNL